MANPSGFVSPLTQGADDSSSPVMGALIFDSASRQAESTRSSTLATTPPSQGAKNLWVPPSISGSMDSTPKSHNRIQWAISTTMRYLNDMSREKLVTYALPYANGPLHLGHLLGMIQADTWARFPRMRGLRCYFFCGDDAHGPPIMLKAREQGKTNEALVDEIYTSHLKDIRA